MVFCYILEKINLLVEVYKQCLLFYGPLYNVYEIDKSRTKTKLHILCKEEVV